MIRRRFTAVRATPPLYAGKKDQLGVSLLLALIFVAFFGGILVTMARFNSFEVRKTEANVAGWELVQIAKAARLYMRDQYAKSPAPTVAAANIFSEIPLTTLKNGGYLPTAFGRVDAGGVPINALNQQIHVFMVNWSAGGLGGTPSVPSAFVYFVPGGKSGSDSTVDIITSARKLNTALTAPLFNTSNVNVSADCRGGGPAVALWDTGCMTSAEFAAMVTPSGLSGTFGPGAVLMPAWKSIQPDLRAVLRYPEPENPGFATMLTDMGMGTPTGDCSLDTNQVHITTTDSSGNITQTTTNVCDSLSDTATTDMRFNINHVGNIMAQRVVAMPQTTDYGGEAGSIGTGNDDAMRVAGDVYLGSDLRVYNTRDLPAGVPSRFDVPNGTVVVERNAYTYSTSASQKGHAILGTIDQANSLISDQLNSVNFTSNRNGTTTGSPQMNVTRTTTLTGQLRVRGDPNAELLTDTMSGNNDDVRISDWTPEGNKAQVTGTLDLGDSTAYVIGSNPAAQAGGFSAVSGEITNTGTVNVTSAQSGGSNADLQFLQPNASLTVNTTSAADLASPLPIINAQNPYGGTARCLEGANVANACADRQYVPPNITP